MGNVIPPDNMRDSNSIKSPKQPSVLNSISMANVPVCFVDTLDSTIVVKYQTAPSRRVSMAILIILDHKDDSDSIRAVSATQSA